jgi:OmpA-OmpF porin, OOP family
MRKLVCVAAVLSLSVTQVTFGADVAGAKDHPLVSRFKGSEAVGYAQSDFGKARLPSGPQGKHQDVSGPLTDIVYQAPAGKRATEVFENYRQALAAAGFNTTWQCGPGTRDDGCGGFRFAGDFADPVIATLKGDSSQMLKLMDAVNNNVSYLLATLVKNGQTSTVALMVSQDDDRPTGVLLRVVESTPMAQGQVTVDAAAMAKGLAAEGKIALYGLHFATDSATLTPDSKQTLDEMAKALKAAPALKVYIVGHTDNTGTLAHNEKLSQDRAAAVVKALTTTYGIAANRLAAKGLASYSPVAANTAEAGKAKNRRVEMVAQ